MLDSLTLPGTPLTVADYDAQERVAYARLLFMSQAPPVTGLTPSAWCVVWRWTGDLGALKLIPCCYLETIEEGDTPALPWWAGGGRVDPWRAAVRDSVERCVSAVRGQPWSTL